MLSPLVWQRCAWRMSRSTVAARVLGISSSDGTLEAREAGAAAVIRSAVRVHHQRSKPMRLFQYGSAGLRAFSSTSAYSM